MQTPDRILKRPEVTAMTGLSRSEIYRRWDKKTFPAPVKLGGKKAIGWKLSVIQHWIAELEPAA